MRRVFLHVGIAVFMAAIVQLVGGYWIAPAEAAALNTRAHLNLSEFTPQRLQWLLQVEDPKFQSHWGVDLFSSHGGETITQRLVGPCGCEDSMLSLLQWRKWRQSLYALAFDRRISKEMQLRLFVNNVPFDDLTIGFSAAARRFFRKPFAELTNDEYLSLLAAVPDPLRYHPLQMRASNLERVARLRRFLAGACKPATRWDPEYSTCAGKT